MSAAGRYSGYCGCYDKWMRKQQRGSGKKYQDRSDTV